MDQSQAKPMTYTGNEGQAWVRASGRAPKMLSSLWALGPSSFPLKMTRHLNLTSDLLERQHHVGSQTMCLDRELPLFSGNKNLC